MTTTLPRRKILGSKYQILPEKTKTLSAGTTILKAVALAPPVKSINFVLSDMDITDAGELAVYAASVADGSGTLKEIHRITVPVANNQTCMIEVDSTYISSVCDVASSPITPLSVVLKFESGANGDTLALTTVIEGFHNTENFTPSAL